MKSIQNCSAKCAVLKESLFERLKADEEVLGDCPSCSLEKGLNMLFSCSFSFNYVVLPLKKCAPSSIVCHISQDIKSITLPNASFES